MNALTHARRSGGERFNERNIDVYLPTAPPMMLEDPVMDWQQGQSRNMGAAGQQGHSDPLGGEHSHLAAV